MPDPLHDVAHISHVELLTPRPQESLDFFRDVMGMTVEEVDGDSVHLRGWGDYHRTSLKLTEADRAGMGHMGLRDLEPRGARAQGRRDRAAGPRDRVDRR